MKKRRSVRLTTYDYSAPGYYFVTICAKNRQNLFGAISNRQMCLNQFGRIVSNCWIEIPEHFKHAQTDEWVVMPDHFHGIVKIMDLCRGTACRVPTGRERFGKPVPGSLGTIVRSFKSASTQKINLIRGTPGIQVWQRNYFERVIRNERELFEMRNYIQNNPKTRNIDANNVGARHAVPLHSGMGAWPI